MICSKWVWVASSLGYLKSIWNHSKRSEVPYYSSKKLYRYKNLKFNNDIPGSWYGFTKMLVSWMQTSWKCLQGPACVFFISFLYTEFYLSFWSTNIYSCFLSAKSFFWQNSHILNLHTIRYVFGLYYSRVRNKGRDTFINFWKNLKENNKNALIDVQIN